ncbi:MAG: thymidine phosphorylase [Fimbriimonadaceae bacterium]
MRDGFDMAHAIEVRRDGGRHTSAELHGLALAAAHGEAPDYQLAAWLMAAYLNPLDMDETAALTLGMAASGKRLDLTGLPKPWVDKHSTGGVGDKTSIVLLPLLAACGLTVVKMSGRGLGITGGTLDKLSSVPGFRLDLTPEELVAQAGRIGLALTGQSPDLAPADKVLYALRDATGTVASVPLIVSSILSKKLAGGAETVVIDVKCGSGAFMTTLAQAETLAAALRNTGKRCGLSVHTEITGMSQPLGAAVGNALEVAEALRVLRNQASTAPERRFEALCLSLAQRTLEAARVAADAEKALRSGAALAKAEAWFAAQGAAAMDPPLERLIATPMPALADGFIAKIDAGAVGELVLDLGGGRRRKDDPVDLQVGVIVNKLVGEPVTAGESVLTVHSRAPITKAALGALTQSILATTPRPQKPPAIG